MGAIAAGDLVDGKYRIIRTIGEGGWGVVFEGENIRTFKRVAIKVLRPHSGLTKDIIQRFEREAQAAGRIGSEHIGEVYDLGALEDGTHYMVMELLTGEELSSRLKNGPIDGVTVAKLTLQLLDGLKAAHEAGILHRDLKPENLFLVPTRTGEEFVKILDFGISKFNANGPHQGSATMTGAVLGSPCYMAPEQARGLKQVDARTDLYAVGTLMFETLTGRVPFTGDNFNDLMFKIVLAPRPDPRELHPQIDPTLALIVVKAMAIDPKDRYQSADAFSAALTDWLTTQGIASVRPPELKRVMSGTPRTSREMRLTPDGRLSTTPSQKASQREDKVTVLERSGSSGDRHSGAVGGQQWDATMPAEGLGTPLVASSASGVPAVKPANASRKKIIAFGAAAAAVVVLGVVALLGHDARPPQTASAIGSEPPAATPPAATSAVQVALPPEQPSAAPEDTAPSASAPAEAESAPSAPAAARPAPHSVTAPPPRATVAAAAPPPATTAAPAPTAAPTAPAKPVSTVEGREIRTGL
jgi:eukaryotic-like serine/threonine-protein kinase